MAGVKSIIHVRENWPILEHKVQRKCAFRSIINNADDIIAINKYSASMFRESGREIKVVYDWIDFSNRYKPMPFDEIFHEDCSRLKVYLFIGGFNPIKGAKQVIDIFINKITGSDCRLLVLGNLDALTDKKCRELIESDDRIICIPPTYQIRHLVEQAYCMLSYFTIPHANLGLAESIILNTPVVAARTPESLEYSLDGRLAQLYPLGNLEAFECAIKDTEDHYDEIINNLHMNSQTVKRMFDKDENMSRIEEVIKHVISNA